MQFGQEETVLQAHMSSAALAYHQQAFSKDVQHHCTWPDWSILGPSVTTNGKSLSKLPGHHERQQGHTHRRLKLESGCTDSQYASLHSAQGPRCSAQADALCAQGGDHILHEGEPLTSTSKFYLVQSGKVACYKQYKVCPATAPARLLALT